MLLQLQCILHALHDKLTTNMVKYTIWGMQELKMRRASVHDVARVCTLFGVQQGAFKPEAWVERARRPCSAAHLAYLG